MRTILISGCGSGFGALGALQFAADGDRVVATMRMPDDGLRAEAVGRGLDLDIRALDVTNANSIADCVAAVEADYGAIDILINNAGIHLLGAIEDMAEDSFRRVFETNFFGAVNLARAVLPGMRRRGAGRIITLSSVGSRIGRVADGAYCASKAAVEIAFEALRHEVARFGVHVSVVCPGAFRTGISRNFRLEEPYASASPYRDLIAFRADKVRAACAGGGDPLEVVRIIQEIARDPAPGFRYLAGQRAVDLDAEIAALDDADRAAFIVRMAGINWWVNGLESPASG